MSRRTADLTAGRLQAHVRRNLVAYVALAAALAATGGVAYSAIPDGGGVIHSCYDNVSGAVRVIDTEASGVCRGGETALDWNQTGSARSHRAAGTSWDRDHLREVEGRTGGPARPGKDEDRALPHRPARELRDLRQGRGRAQACPGIPARRGTEILYCNLLHNERRLAATIFGCAVQAGESSDLGRANLIAGANHQSAYQTVSANVLHSFDGNSNKISLTCLQYAGGKWPAGVHNTRLIAMKVDRINPLNAFRAFSLKVSKPKRKPKLRARP